MKDLLFIINAERRTLLRGLLFSFLVILPFTFLPTLLSNGWNRALIIQRVPDSVLYSLLMAAAIVIAAVIYNYNNLVERKALFHRPAFTSLDFYGRLDGIGSITRELETFLLGKIGNYYFRLNLLDVDKESKSIEIVPLIDLKDFKEIKKYLVKELGFQQNFFFGLSIPFTEAELDSEHFIRVKLEQLASRFKELEIPPYEIDEEELQD